MIDGDRVAQAAFHGARGAFDEDAGRFFADLAGFADFVGSGPPISLTRSRSR